uniref:Uncharacterized protein n=1 Tax=Anguilla anguilla TaxID=7936 RepID=A0A0E9X9L2_ANGAN
MGGRQPIVTLAMRDSDTSCNCLTTQSAVSCGILKPLRIQATGLFMEPV